ncbi:hypothetical protein FS837_010661 [Tulasnella sp. UAMH 9824]|nr:hypothetical protein FS837_010661 [Tulasnella sp. UAMH 9824]
MDSDDLTQEISLVFNGVDGAEAESFISSVQQVARTEGRSRDNEWIVDLVSTCVKGEALRWYVELDEDTQNDWKLLRKAILRQWPSRAEPSAPFLPPTIPIPAAAPQPTSSVSLPQPTEVPKPTRRIRVKLPPPRPPSPQSLMHQTPDSQLVYRIRLYFSGTKSDLFLSNDGAAQVCLTKGTGEALNVRWTLGNELQLVEPDPKTQRMIWMTWYLPGP